MAAVEIDNNRVSYTLGILRVFSGCMRDWAKRKIGVRMLTEAGIAMVCRLDCEGLWQRCTSIIFDL